MRKHVFALTLLCVAIVAFLSGNYLQSPGRSTDITRTVRVTDYYSEIATATIYVTRMTTQWITTSETKWRSVISFGARGDWTAFNEHVTGTFRISSSTWRIRWSFGVYLVDYSDFAFQVYLYANKPDEGDTALDSISRSKQARDEGVLYLSGSGLFYLRIKFGYGVVYSIAVEEVTY